MTGSAVAKMRRSLSRRPDAQRLLHRLGVIATAAGLTLTVGQFTADAWWDDDPVAVATLAHRVDRVAEWLDCTVTARAPDGTVLYQRIHVP